MTFVQLGKDMTEREIAVRLIMSFADRIDGPVHFVPPIALLPARDGWPLRGVLG